MRGNLPQANDLGQAKICWREIDILPCQGNDTAMTSDQTQIDAPLYIGEWIKVLRLKQKHVAAASGVSAPYLNQLIKGGKDNPTVKMLSKIADAMDLTVKDLQTMPPSAAELEAIQRVPASLAERIRRPRKTG